jgi:hypothetical protein
MLNIRQQKYKKNRLLGMNKINAARSAGYSEATARNHSKALEERCKIADLLERQGLTDKVLIEKHRQLLEATKVIGYLHNYKRSEKGVTERVSPDEVISNEFLDIPDYGVQIKALELAYKLKDLLKDKVEHDVTPEFSKMIESLITKQDLPNNRLLAYAPDSKN